MRLTRSRGREPRGTTLNFPGSPVSPQNHAYIGRFAPSPTGSLHLGSLVAALGSFLDARSRGGRWLLRMEDLDRTRVVPGSAERRCCARSRPSVSPGTAPSNTRAHELPRYRAALERLAAAGLTYECSCSRRERADPGRLPRHLPAGPTRPDLPPPASGSRRCCVEFTDRVQGHCRFDLGERGDVIVRRRDGAFAYQLAVVVDDARQGVTDVVRGADLLDSTAWQIGLQRALQLPTPALRCTCRSSVEPDGAKLAKSTPFGARGPAGGRRRAAAPGPCAAAPAAPG